MLFRTVVPEDREWIVPLIAGSGETACEYSFGNIYMWSGSAYRTRIARIGDFLAAEEYPERPNFMAPVGTGDDRAFLAALDALTDRAREYGFVLRMHRVSEACCRRITRLCGDRFTVEPDRDSADYLYLRNDLADLSGKRYHGKRNHISAFCRAFPDWHCEEITADNLADCAAVNEEWYAERLPEDPGAADELYAVRRGLERFSEIGLYGKILYAGGRPAAYSFGDRVNPDCFVTHVEKALPEFPGAYAVINREMAASLTDVRLINREEDMGHDGLRTAKLSYHPMMLGNKYTVTEKG